MQLKLSDKGLARTLEEPLVVECGIDAEKFAVGVAFTLPAGVKINLPGLPDRISESPPQGPFETLLGRLRGHFDRVVLRHQPSIRRIEIVTLLGIPNKMDAAAMLDRQAVCVVELEAMLNKETPKIAAYVELADTDYPSLLREDSLGFKLPASPTGEVLAKGFKDIDAARRARAQQTPAEPAVRVSSSALEPTDEITIAGSNEQIDEYIQRIKALEAQIEEITKVVGKLKTQMSSKTKKARGRWAKLWPFRKGRRGGIGRSVYSRGGTDAGHRRFNISSRRTSACTSQRGTHKTPCKY